MATIYKQYDTRWAKLKYPVKCTVGGSGCGLVALTNLLIEYDKYKKDTPKSFYSYMKQFAVDGDGTKRAGVATALKHYGFKDVQRFQTRPIKDLWPLLAKGYRGLFVMSSVKAGSKKITWTTSGHYITIYGYKYENGKHYLRCKDSGTRGHDGWYTYEEHMRGAVSDCIVGDPSALKTTASDKPKEETSNTATKIIDVSYAQKDINWAKVAADGVKGVIIRCGYRGYGSGSLNKDDYFLNNIKGASKSGLNVGVYFFTEAITAAEGREEAQFAIKQIQSSGVEVNYPIAIDTENINAKNPTPRANNLSVAKRTEVIKAFCEEIIKQGYEPMIYASTSWLNNKLDMSKLPYKVWVAQYASKCEYKGKYVMWQYSSDGKVNGISGRVDMNHCYMEPTVARPIIAQTVTITAKPSVRKAVSWAIEMTKNDNYGYKKWTSDVNTHKCPICNPNSGLGFNCIGFVSGALKHGGGFGVKCSMDGIGNNKFFTEVTEDSWRKRNGKDWQMLTNGGNKGGSGIPVSQLKPGDVVIKYDDTGTYKHVAMYIGDGQVAEAISSGTKAQQVHIAKYSGKYTRAFRYVGEVEEPEKSVDEIALEVLDGKWGSGKTRKAKLTEAGYDYDAVQNRVNAILKERADAEEAKKAEEARLKAETEELARKQAEELAKKIDEEESNAAIAFIQMVQEHNWDINSVLKKISALLSEPSKSEEVVEEPKVEEQQSKTYTGELPTTTLTKTNEQVIADTIKWLVWHADDNNFHYGYTNKDKTINAHHNGCYYCGTQVISGGRSKKGIVGWEKTYCCNPFIGAGFAHGGCVSEALKLCRKGSSWDYHTGKGYDISPLFTKLGHPNKSDLPAGAVLCRGTHVAMYIGNGKIVEAGGSDDNVRNSKKWNNSIRVCDLTDENYAKFPRAYMFNGEVNTTVSILPGELSDRVKLWQEYLNWYFGEKVVGVDGEYGDATWKYTKEFQEKEIGVGQGDGYIGPITLEAAAKVTK